MTDLATTWVAQHGRRSLRLSLPALALSIVAMFLFPRAALFGYLTAFLLCSGVPLGCAAILMLHHLVGGRWGNALRAPMATAALTVPLLVPLFLPMALGIAQLYPWAGAASAHEPLLIRKQAYLNEPFFLGRAALVLLLWSVGGWLLHRASLPATSRGANPLDLPRAPRLAAIGLIVYVITVSFAAIDWVGSLEPLWYSSIFGLYILIGQALSAMALLILAATLGTPSADDASGPSLSAGAPDVLHDLGTLLLVLVVLHAYFAYSQFFIIWNGNLPQEIAWYIPRTREFWGGVALLLILVHFLLPFALLLSRENKRRAIRLRRVVIVILAARSVEAMWIVLPSYDGPLFGALLLALLSMIALGGIWLGVFSFAWRMSTARAAAAARLEGPVQ